MLPSSRTFMIGLRSGQTRLDDTLWHLKERGIYPEIFWGFDYTRTGLDTLNWETLINSPGQWRMGPLQTGCYLSHYSLWQTAYHAKLDTTIILEDDVRFKPNWHKTMISVAANLPNDWDLLFIGSCCTSYNVEPIPISVPIYQVKHCLCTHAYAVRGKCLPFLLEQLEHIDSKIDVSLCLKVIPKLKTYAIRPRIAHQSHTFLYA